MHISGGKITTRVRLLRIWHNSGFQISHNLPNYLNTIALRATLSCRCNLVFRIVCKNRNTDDNHNHLRVRTFSRMELENQPVKIFRTCDGLVSQLCNIRTKIWVLRLIPQRLVAVASEWPWNKNLVVEYEIFWADLDLRNLDLGSPKRVFFSPAVPA